VSNDSTTPQKCRYTTLWNISAVVDALSSNDNRLCKSLLTFKRNVRSCMSTSDVRRKLHYCDLLCTQRTRRRTSLLISLQVRRRRRRRTCNQHTRSTSLCCSQVRLRCELHNKSTAFDLTSDMQSPVHTVAEKWDCRRKRRGNGDSLTFLRECGQAFI